MARGTRGYGDDTARFTLRPGPIARTDAAWANFDAQLQRTGSVDWPTADAAFNLAGICQNMEAAPLSPHRTITASVGAATWTPAMTGPTDLLDTADHTLYFGKKRRNCAVHVESIHEIANNCGGNGFLKSVWTPI